MLRLVLGSHPHSNQRIKCPKGRPCPERFRTSFASLGAALTVRFLLQVNTEPVSEKNFDVLAVDRKLQRLGSCCKSECLPPQASQPPRQQHFLILQGASLLRVQHHLGHLHLPGLKAAGPSWMLLLMLKQPWPPPNRCLQQNYPGTIGTCKTQAVEILDIMMNYITT